VPFLGTLYFDIAKRSGVTHECDKQTDGQTDILVANAALYYVTWQNIPSLYSVLSTYKTAETSIGV